MNSLFKEYKDAGKLTEALLIGRNMVNKNPGDTECVSEYMDFLLSLAEKLPVIDEKKSFIGQANITLSFYEENAELSSEIIDRITAYRARIAKITEMITGEERDSLNEKKHQIMVQNNKLLKELFSIKGNLEKTKEQEEFNRCLEKISSIDAQIDHDNLSEEQKGVYDQLNRDCTEKISSKMRELECIGNIEYNKKAVEAYYSAYQKFRGDESKYKNQSQLFILVSNTLFAFDAARLFNETLVFYNHVYSYIFGKLDDDGKFAITKFSIDCERKLR